MAKRKNAVKSGLNQLRQALLDVKTAIIHFSDDHIVSIGYDPSSKATVVTDIPQNLSSQFTLGEGGGGGSLDLHPKVTVNVTIEGESASMPNNSIIYGDFWLVIQDNNVLVNSASLDADNIVNFNNGDTKEVTTFIPVDSPSFPVYKLLIGDHYIQDLVVTNCVNCTDSTGYITITDTTQDASADVTLTLGGGD